MLRCKKASPRGGDDFGSAGFVYDANLPVPEPFSSSVACPLRRSPDLFWPIRTPSRRRPATYP